MFRIRTFLGCVAILFLGTFFVAGRLRHVSAGDEAHFQTSAEAFQGRFELEALRSYPEVVTPLALLIWGELEHFTGDGLFYGRLLNLALTFAMVCLVALCAPREWPRPALAAVGLLLFPYTLPLGVHLYTDTLGAFLVVGGTLALARGHPAIAWWAFACAISTRQYLVQIPAALAAVEGVHWLRGEPVRWKDLLVCLASGVTLLAWIAFFGGLAPEPGIEFWTPLYPAPMLRATDFILHQGLYALTGVGAYFVLVEALLFRRRPVAREMQDWRGLLLALGLAGLFWLDPPLPTANLPGGPIGRVSLALWPAPDLDWVRVGIYSVLALLCLLRFAGRLDIGFWLVAAACVLAMKQQLAWEKYLFPTLAVLWTMVALGRLSGYGTAAVPSEAGENALTKQALPRSGFHRFVRT